MSDVDPGGVEAPTGPTPEPEPEPSAVYRERLRAREAVLPGLDARSRLLSAARLSTFLLALVALFVAWQLALPWWLPLVPALGFLVLVAVHDRLLRRLARARRAVAHYQAGLARLEDRWAGQGSSRSDFAVIGDAHPFAADLDLVGEGSLFELLSRARTRAGEDTLARWLSPGYDAGRGGVVDLPTVAELQARQQAVTALRSLLDLRETWAVQGEAPVVGVDPQQLIDWGRAPASFAAGLGRRLRVAAVLVPVLGLGSIVAWILGWGPWALLATLAVGGLIHKRLEPVLHRVVGPAQRRGDELAILSELMAVLEGAGFTAPPLQRLQRTLIGAEPRGPEAPGVPGVPEVIGASQAIAKLRRLLAWYEVQRNALFMPIALLFLWGPRFALAIDDWRRRQGPRIGAWLEALGEFEALSSLASHAFEHPDDPFPELVAIAEGTEGIEARVLEGEGLGHPLLPVASCVRNDSRLVSPVRAYVISGSNMSGKSTFLRTVGSNVVLALAGAPVRARRLRLSPTRIGATLRVQDSLREGASRFWAELTRLRAVSDLASAGPCLFLLDEILHGTNSHDRRIGAEALLRSLIERGALGLLTTHDLALARAAETLAPRAANVHFRDVLVDGELVFDYRMHPGVVEVSNALALMRSIGLL